MIIGPNLSKIFEGSPFNIKLSPQRSGILVNRVAFAILAALTIVSFQNCSPTRFSAGTNSSSGPDKAQSHSQAGFQLGGTETYDGKLTFHNYDLDLSCGPGDAGLPKVRFVFETDGVNHSVARGPCQETTGSPFLDALPTAGSTPVADSALAKNPYNPNALIVHLLVFQTPSSAAAVGVIYELWKAEQFAIPATEKMNIDFMLVRKSDGSRTLSFITARTVLATGQRLEAPYLSPELSMDSQVTGPQTLRNTAYVVNSSGTETGRIFLDADTAIATGSLSSSGAVGYSGPFQSNNVPIFIP